MMRLSKLALLATTLVGAFGSGVYGSEQHRSQWVQCATRTDSIRYIESFNGRLSTRKIEGDTLDALPSLFEVEVNTIQDSLWEVRDWSTNLEEERFEQTEVRFTHHQFGSEPFSVTLGLREEHTSGFGSNEKIKRYNDSETVFLLGENVVSWDRRWAGQFSTVTFKAFDENKVRIIYHPKEHSRDSVTYELSVDCSSVEG